MKHKAIYLVSAALGAALFASGAAWAQMSASTGKMGNYCSTPTKTCELSRASWIGNGCSCRVPGGRARGYVSNNYSQPYAGANPIGGLAAVVAAPVEAAAAVPEAVAAAATAPLTTGRSVATGQMGNFCATSVKTCELRHASYIGGGCSCRVPGGRARGTVSP
jgi:hypothetical protein